MVVHFFIQSSYLCLDTFQSVSNSSILFIFIVFNQLLLHQIGTLPRVVSLTYHVGMNLLCHISFLWRHFSTDREHILLMAAVAFGSSNVQQEKVDSMTEWKRRSGTGVCP